MKPRNLQFLPRTLMVCVAPLLVCATAQAEVVFTNESNTTGVWTLPSGTNLLTGRAPADVVVTHESSSNSWSTVVDGTLGDVGGSAGTSVTPNNGNTVTFPLDLTSKPAGYNITSFDSYCTWGNSGRDNQNYMLQYSTVANPTNFITVSTVDLRTGNDRSTHTRVTDTSGFLATGVHSVRLVFDRSENGYVGYREFVLQDDSTVINVDNRSRNDINWPPLVGPNLLNGTAATPPPVAPVHGGDTASSTWATVTDGVLGTTDTPGNGQSVTPNDGNTVTFPLDLAAKPAGYDITSFESYAAWGSNGRDDQRFKLEYSVVGAPETFLPLTEVFNHTEYPPDTAKKATRTLVTRSGGTPLALGVAAIRLTFHDQENGYCGYREFILRDTPPVMTVVNESNNTNIWTLPSGTNLLANSLPKDPPFAAGSNHGPTDNTSPNWSVLTDGSVGSAGTQDDSVGPNNDTFVIFPLDISTNSKGYNLTSLDTYAAWANSGRDDQNYVVSYSTAEAPTVWIPIQTVANQTLPPVNATHTRIASTTGNVLGTHVGAIKFDFAGQENGWVGFREFVALGTPVPLFTPLTWSGATNSTWDTAANNWKDGTVSSPYNALAPLTFDSNGANTSINIPAAINAASLTFTNGISPAYTFGGDLLTVANSISLEGAGNATFNNPIVAGGISVSGTGSLTLGTDNELTTSIAVSNGALNVKSNNATGTAAVTLTGGVANFTTDQPTVVVLSGTGGSVVLGNSAGAGTDSALYVGNSISSTYAGGITDASATANGSLTKVGAGTLTLSGTNNYTGTTTVDQGALTLGKRVSLYNGNTAMWTGSNIIVSTSLNLRVGGAGEFTSADVAALGTGGFDPLNNAALGLDTTSGNAVISDVVSSTVPLLKQGVNSLTLSGNNTFTKGITVIQGALVGANPSGPSFSSDVTVGNVTYDAFVNMAFDNQFKPGVLLKFNVGNTALNGKVQLRGTNQTIAGLESGEQDRLAMIQNDEAGTPGYTTDPGPASLTIDTAVDHFFNGFIRNQNGGSISVVKKGAGLQEFTNRNIPTNYSYDGSTTVESGTLRLNFRAGNSGFSSNVAIASGATFHLRGDEVNGAGFSFGPVISGAGKLVVDGTNAVRLTNNSNTWTGGTTVGSPVPASYYGFLALVGNGGVGAGNAENQFCVAGAMTPSNVVTVNGGATLALDGPTPLGQSTVLPGFAPSVRINEGSLLSGGNNTIAFVPNLTLDGAEVRITGGSTLGGFNTNLTFVGTVVVPAGSSTRASQIFTDAAFLPGGTTPSDNANVSLGSAALPGTIFDVADATGNSDADLVISSSLTDVRPGGVASASPLTKSGLGTLAITGVNSYTGDTTISGGELTVNGSSIPDTNKLIIDGGKLGLAGDETVGTLYYAGALQVPGTYGSLASSATFKSDARFSGTGVLTVTGNSGSDSYSTWANVIPNAGDRDRSDDPDGDGFTNLQEYLFGTSPIGNTGALSTVEKSGSNLVIRWFQRAPGTYVVQESATLMADSWTTSAVVPANAADQGVPYSGDYVRKEAIIPIDSAKKFIRIKATE